MPDPRSTPTTRQRELAERLRELRMEKNLTVESVSTSLLVSASKISRLETAARRASPRDVRDLCLLYGVSNEERDRLMALAAQAMETSWYQDADIDAEFRTFVGLEQAATNIDTMQTNVVPGLLQTTAYARCLVSGLRAPNQMPATRVEEVLSVRERRQEILHGANPPALHAIVDEMAVRRPLGPPDVMHAQVAALRAACELPHVAVQLIPLEAGSHPGLDGRFTVLRFTDRAVRDTVYVEGLLGELFLDKDTDVARYLQTFDFLAKHVALDGDDSLALLEKIGADWAARR
ncbi:helix-turn-helix transcriptional regulator [Kineosporia sp. R_H_3]|uniref:helix-turn-helix domain-containing protein n=1 Tax=Kineosporia sp. R_H_3 TaxID=1961848 RepID=UPI000B4BC307|nr:helix-turn-helix transcriptional regulator [Kineosporia sp. R_H_3]